MNATELQVYLANTAHQREVADLQAAGLNPILSAHSSGAAVPNVMSGGSGGSDVSARAVDRAFHLAETAVKWNSRGSDNKTSLGTGPSAERMPGGGFTSSYMGGVNSAQEAQAEEAERAWYDNPLIRFFMPITSNGARTLASIRNGTYKPPSRQTLADAISFIQPFAPSAWKPFLTSARTALRSSSR